MVIAEIIILAMIAAFLGLRLYSVLGRRAEHEEEAIPSRFEKQGPGARNDASMPQAQQQPGIAAARELDGFPPAVERGLRDIAAADRQFDLMRFMEGSKLAYGMVLEAFWAGDRETLRQLCDDDVYQGFAGAIDAREEAGEILENRLIRIEENAIHSAQLDGHLARISIRFAADIAALTRDKDGNMIAGSLDDAVETRDIWTFVRDVNSAEPAWLLDETDEG